MKFKKVISILKVFVFYLEFLDLFRFGNFSFSDARLKERGSHGDPEGLGGHPRFGGFWVSVNDTKSAEQKNQQMLRVNWQRQENAEKNKNKNSKNETVCQLWCADYAAVN